MLYVKKEVDKFNRVRYLESEVKDDWSQDVVDFQTELLTNNDYLPVLNISGTNDRISIFGRVIKKYEEVLDEDKVIGYNLIYQFIPNKIRLSQVKLLSNPIISNKLPELMNILKTNETLKDWWINNLTYVRGSEVAQLAMQAFGFTQDQLEKLVLSCRA